MFNKKCPNCNEKIKETFDFCPYCGRCLKNFNDREKYGLLGKNDAINMRDFPLPFSEGFLSDIIRQTFKILEKQMKELNENVAEDPNNIRFPDNFNIQFFINGKKVSFDKKDEQKIKENNLINTLEIPNEKLKEIAKLPRIEPSSKIKRYSNKIIYELEVPGVESIKDVIINKLENSIEIKALAKNNVYLKNINLNLPILNYRLEKGNLIIELKAE